MKIINNEGNSYSFPPKYTDGPRPPLKFYDRPMGTGKTYDLLNGFDPNTQYLVVHEFVEQFNDVLNNPSKVQFFQPEADADRTKADHLSQLLRLGVNIVCSHVLYTKLPASDRQRYLSKYVIIIDETFDTLKNQMGPDKATWEALVDKGFAEVNEEGKVNPLPIWYEQQDDLNKSLTIPLRDLAESGSLYVTKARHFFVVPIPIELLTAGNSVTVMTFQAQGSVLSAYLDRLNIPYTVDRDRMAEWKLKADIRRLVTLYDIPALKNESFSFSAQTTNIKHAGYFKRVAQALKNIRSRKMNGVALDRIMVGCAKQNWYHVQKNKYDLDQSSGFSKGSTILRANWVAPGIRGLNKYGKCSQVICLYNYNLSPAVLEWLDREDDRTFKEQYALIELLQFIFRSRIRHRTRRKNDTDITLFLPCSRMRRIFRDWVNEGVEPEDKLKVMR